MSQYAPRWFLPVAAPAAISGRRKAASRRLGGTVRSGFTLLEVILALAILAGAIAMLTEAVRIARRNGQAAVGLTTAQLVAASKMSEIVAQVTPLSAVTDAPSETEPDCFYSITPSSTSTSGLIAVTVTVKVAVMGMSKPVEYSLVQWMPDPGVDLSSSTDDSAASTGGTNAAGTSTGQTNGP